MEALLKVEEKAIDLDKRLSILERTTDGIREKMSDVDAGLVKITEGLQKIELKTAYAAGGFAVAIIVGQIALQILMQGIAK